MKNVSAESKLKDLWSTFHLASYGVYSNGSLKAKRSVVSLSSPPLDLKLGTKRKLLFLFLPFFPFILQIILFVFHPIIPILFQFIYTTLTLYHSCKLNRYYNIILIPYLHKLSNFIPVFLINLQLNLSTK